MGQEDDIGELVGRVAEIMKLVCLRTKIGAWRVRQSILESWWWLWTS